MEVLVHKYTWSHVGVRRRASRLVRMGLIARKGSRGDHIVYEVPEGVRDTLLTGHTTPSYIKAVNDKLRGS